MVLSFMYIVSENVCTSLERVWDKTGRHTILRFSIQILLLVGHVIYLPNFLPSGCFGCVLPMRQHRR